MSVNHQSAVDGQMPTTVPEAGLCLTYVFEIYFVWWR